VPRPLIQNDISIHLTQYQKENTMAGQIYIINDQNQLVSMHEQDYDSEDLLQRLLAEYPDLLASDQIGEEPRRWLLITREIAVPDDEDVVGRWSLDHLFIDQQGIPTLVEVKRSSDSRIRREVVGQMLDYAANAVVYWKIATIRAQFEARCQVAGLDPDEYMTETLGLTTSVDDFWQTVATNLDVGKIRMVFVADKIPHELRRIIEFLNEQMTPAEVLGVEIQQFAGEGLRTLVPKVYGQTAKTYDKKTTSSRGETWTEERFFSTLLQNTDELTAQTAYRILEWCKMRQLPISWGTGNKNAAFVPKLDYNQKQHSIIALYGR
jgi:hypothetical protein